jgi:hypothetical protein
MQILYVTEMIHNVLLDVFVDLYQLNAKVFHQFHQYQIHMNEHLILLDMKVHDNDDQYVIHFHQFQYRI